MNLEKGIEILGAHRVPIAMTEWADPAVKRDRRVGNIWLIELITDTRHGGFNPEEFTQEDEGLERDRWQIAYDERFLDPSGTRMITPTAGTPVRVLFFFHYLKLDEPLITPYGPITIPNETPVPGRLSALVKYYRP